MSTDFEIVVVGAGVVGLAIGRQLARQGRNVVVLERHGLIGSETSSRNSEVIHAGIYYPPGSARASLCVRGKKLLYDFAEENGVGFRKCGKILVAVSQDELPKLAAIARNAEQNGVDDLTPLSRDEIRALEPELDCVAGYFSPSTGVIDSHGLMLALEGHLTHAGGMVSLNTAVSRFERGPAGTFIVHTEGEDGQFAISCEKLVIAAGLGASALGAAFHHALGSSPGYSAPRLYPAKGHYFSLAGRSPFRHLVYPMPVKGGLGVHLTLDIAGRAKFGPDVEWKDGIDYRFEDEGGARKARFEAEIRRYWPGLPEQALTADYTGIRPKIYGANDPAADFELHGPRQHGIAGMVALYGIESPGLTSSLAIAEAASKLLT